MSAIQNTVLSTVKFPTRYRWAPAATLLVLAPLVAEVLFGATHLTTLFLLIPQICIYGGGALIIRELAYRYHRNGGALLLLAVAFAILEEGVILQTSVSPLFFGGDPARIYSWAAGVNWVYLLWALGYESVWAILLPIKLTELIFPGRRREPWAGRRGLAAAGAAYLFASGVVWYRFTQVGILPGKAYSAPLPLVIAALACAGALVAAAFVPWKFQRSNRAPGRRAPRPWLAGLAAFGLALPWFTLPILVYAGPVPFPAGLPLGIGLGWAAAALLLVRRWSASSGWGDSHQLSLIGGALLASMLAGFLVSGMRLPVDLVGKLVFNGIAILLLVRLAWKLRQRKTGVQL